MIQGPILHYIFVIKEDVFVEYPPLEESDAFNELNKLFPPCEEFKSAIKYGGSNARTFMGTGQEQDTETYKKLKILFGKEERMLDIYGVLEVDDFCFERVNKDE